MHTESSERWVHDHTFGRDGKRSSEKRRQILSVVTLLAMVVEIGAGLAFGSIALLFLLPSCDRGGAGQVTITGKTVYAGMAIEEVQVRVLRPDGDRWKESGAGRSGYHGSFIVKTNPGTIRLEARGEIFRNNEKIPLAGRVAALDVPSGTRRMDRIVIELAPVPD